jgi:heme/copper-type cytochrome/quinol oxidase subunit 4
MLHASWSGLAHGRANPLAPFAVTVLGFAVLLAGYRAVGAGVMAGAVLAFLNGLALSHRVELAADQGDIGRALLVMQLSFLITCTVIAVPVVIMIHFSVTMAVAAAIAFGVSQVAMVLSFYFTRARHLGKVESNAS